MRKILLMIASILISGCSSTSLPPTTPDVAPPTPKEFFPDQYAFQIHGGVDEVRTRIITSLNSLDIPYKQQIEGINTFVVTSYMREGKGPYTNRTVVSALKFTLNPHPPTCTYATLQWYVTSKGDFDAEWRVLDSDRAFHPSRLETVKQQLATQPCK